MPFASRFGVAFPGLMVPRWRFENLQAQLETTNQTTRWWEQMRKGAWRISISMSNGDGGDGLTCKQYSSIIFAMEHEALALEQRDQHEPRCVCPWIHSMFVPLDTFHVGGEQLVVILWAWSAGSQSRMTGEDKEKHIIFTKRSLTEWEHGSSETSAGRREDPNT